VCDLYFKGDNFAYGSIRLDFMIVFLSHSWQMYGHYFRLDHNCFYSQVTAS